MVTVRRQLQWWLPKRDRRRAEGASTLSWRLFWGFREGDFTFPPRKAGKNPRFSSALTPSPADGRPEERAPAEEAPPQRRRGGTRARPAPPRPPLSRPPPRRAAGRRRGARRPPPALAGSAPPRRWGGVAAPALGLGDWLRRGLSRPPLCSPGARREWEGKPRARGAAILDKGGDGGAVEPAEPSLREPRREAETRPGRCPA